MTSLNFDVCRNAKYPLTIYEPADFIRQQTSSPQFSGDHAVREAVKTLALLRDPTFFGGEEG